MKQTLIPCIQMRGGTSKAACFLASDLPADSAMRDRVLLAAMGSPDVRQIDGIGGADPLTSKVAIISPSTRADADVNYLFAQVNVDKAIVDYGQNCGNILAAVAPFAIEKGLVQVQSSLSRVRIYMVNTDQIAEAQVHTPDGAVEYEGDTRIDGVPGFGAEQVLTFADIAGSSCGALLPTGRPRDRFDGIDVTCIDNGMPVVIVRAADFSRSGLETREQLDSDDELKARLESIRIQAGKVMNLGDVTHRTVPKMTLVAPPSSSGTVTTRTFIPHRCHASIGVLGAVSVATACLIEGAVTNDVARVSTGDNQRIMVEHPTGEFGVMLERDDQGNIIRSGLIRTARLLFRGYVAVPGSLWSGYPKENP
ncbi:MAG: 4-oxalomesaconate tautomerase [Enterobacterales bacterium endosymbiont of Blomia tropicalis]|uniref:4-oxalomesaconate tautomerase n=1 Tax=Mixta mediterraneensis TaxID=2758443 RepID=UPI0025A87589|nr:4-oxalomesaconate tautomerase [Mixta mediterraneensis]MDL4916251.1 4-oxalomesaconate tautomerase [Mixta mediterraneensis]